jgi:uncharacterized membrane protein
MLSPFLQTLIMGMTPVVELRGAIPFGLALGLDPLTCYIAAVLGNCIPIPFIILFIEHVFRLMRKLSPKFGALVDKLEQRADEKSDVVQKYALWGLVILVAIPLPGTGAWTGSLVAALMNIPLRKSGPACVLGVLIAGVAVMAISTGVIAIVT